MAGTIPEKWGIYGIFCCCHGLSDSRRCTGLGVWGVANLLEGYGSDSPGAKMLEVHRDIKQKEGKCMTIGRLQFLNSISCHHSYYIRKEQHVSGRLKIGVSNRCADFEMNVYAKIGKPITA